MKVHFLQASVPLTKTFKLDNGVLTKEGHPRVINYTSHEANYETLDDLVKLLVKHADLGHCLLKGELARPLHNESRASTTDQNKPTRLICLDYDGAKGVGSIDEALQQLGMGDIDYIVQYSSSMGVTPERGLSAHVFVLLDKPVSPAILKQFLIDANLKVPALRQNLGLTRTNNALRWTLDVTTCQNDKLIYIAPPILGEGVKDSFKGKRIQLVKRKKRFYTLPTVPTAEANRVASEAALNDLREKGGLPKRKKISMKSQGSVEYMSKPDQAVVTGIKTERGFTYLNVNGGDSWAYYHAENNPEFIYNFKGDPIFKTSEFLPDYWNDVREVMNAPRITADGTMYLAFRDFKTATYWNGIWHNGTQELVLAPAKTSQQLKDFLKQHGQPVGDYVPDWNLAFNPHSDLIVDPDTKFVNLYQPSQYMRMKPRVVKEIPPMVRRFVKHALGGDEECLEHFMNWFAVILQHKTRTGTAWVMHGVQGTGKGLLMDRIFRPIFGQKYVVHKRISELYSEFNGYMEQCFILFVDEAETEAFRGKDEMAANFKSFIAEPMISVRKMYTMPYEVQNYMNMVFAGNKDCVVQIDPSDRRFNVGAYQTEKLVPTEDDLRQLEDELVDFYCYLMTRPANKDLARTPLNNSAKAKMIHVSQSSIDIICGAITTGDFRTLWEQRPTGDISQAGNVSRAMIGGAYIRLLDEIIKGKPNLTREEVHTILEYTIGGMPQSPYKLTSLLKHHKVLLEPVYRDGRTVRGLKVNWKIPEDIIKETSKSGKAE